MTTAARPRVLTIAGSDPSGGAGLQADLATFARLGVEGTAAVTAITVQTSHAVQAVHPLPAPLVRAQIEAAFDEAPVAAVKLGLLPGAAIVRAVAAVLRERRPPNIVLDPVLASSSGAVFLDDGALEALRRELVPLADVVTPNLPEAAMLGGAKVPSDRAAMEDMARKLLRLPMRAVLLKGGHLGGPESPDLLAKPDALVWLEGRRSPRPGRGTGCRLAAAVAAQLARTGDLTAAARAAKALVGAYLSNGRRIGP